MIRARIVELLAPMPDQDLEDFASFMESDADRERFWDLIRQARTQ